MAEPCNQFLSTLPARGATGTERPRDYGILRFLSTLPARGATQTVRVKSTFNLLFLSTLPARGATETGHPYLVKDGISIHAPREGSDMGIPTGVHNISVFLSTLPARGATFKLNHCCAFHLRFLSTLPARGATANVLKNKRLPSAAFV